MRGYVNAGVIGSIAVLLLAGCDVSINTGDNGTTTSTPAKPTTSGDEVQELIDAQRRYDESLAELRAKQATCPPGADNPCFQDVLDISTRADAEFQVTMRELVPKVANACRAALERNLESVFNLANTRGLIQTCSSEVGQ